MERFKDILLIFMVIGCFQVLALLIKRERKMKLRKKSPENIVRDRLEAIINHKGRLVAESRVFSNANGEKYREIRVVNQGDYNPDYSIELKEIRDIMRNLSKDSYFMEVDKIVFRSYDYEKEKVEETFQPSVLKLARSYTTEEIKKIDWEGIEHEEVMMMGTEIYY